MRRGLAIAGLTLFVYSGCSGSREPTEPARQSPKVQKHAPTQPSPFEKPTPSGTSRLTQAEAWKLIEAGAYASDPDTFEERMRRLLQALDTDQLLAFDQVLVTLHAKLNTWDFRMAVHLTDSSASDPKDFTAWLLVHGAARFERTLKNPDTIIELNFPENGADLAYFWSWPAEIVDARRGSTDTPSAFDRIEDNDVLGTRRQETDLAELRKRYPRIYAKHGADYEEYLKHLYPERKP